MGQIRAFQVMELVAAARRLHEQGRDVIHMEVGEPDFPTAAPIIEAGQRALAAGATRYTESRGRVSLREAIAGLYRSRHGIELDPERIIVTPGASGALQLAMGIMVNPGDEVLLADPGYPCNRHFVALFGGHPRAVPVGPETAYQLNADLAAEYWSARTRALLVASPSNPTGTIVSRRELQGMAELVARHGGIVISDEIYHGLSYGGPVTSMLEVDDCSLVVNSFSKFFGMTGWRLGWLVAPPELAREAEKLAQNIFLAPATLSQYAAEAAFLPETLKLLEQRRQAFAERRDYLLPALTSLGFRVPVQPEGAFYIYADCSELTDDSAGFAARALEATGVAFTPGMDFGDHRPGRHVRFAYTTGMERLREGVDRLADWLAKQRA